MNYVGTNDKKCSFVMKKGVIERHEFKIRSFTVLIRFLWVNLSSSNKLLDMVFLKNYNFFPKFLGLS